MKFKNSHILLMVMAIFLLISIGSVCASENVTGDSDVQLADEDSGVALGNENTDGGALSNETTQEKVNTTVVTDKDTYGFNHDDEKSFSVDVKNNESQSIAVNKSDLALLEGNTTINFEYNNSMIKVVDELSVGNHSLTINYLGNANYTNSSKLILFQVFGNETLNVPETIVSDGLNIIIPVSVYNGVDYIELEENKFKLTLIYTNETGNVTSKIINNFNVQNGNITLTISDIKLIAASLNVNYTDAQEPKNVSIKVATKVNATDDKIKVSEDKNITVNVLDSQNNNLLISKNDLKVLENGRDLAFGYNNSVITIDDLAIGIHNLTIVYNGNETYNASSKSIILKVWGNQTIDPTKTVAVDENNKVTITLNLNDGADPVTIDPSKLTVTLYFKNGNTTTNRTLSESDIEVNDQNITFEVTESFETAYAEIKYVAENNLTGNTTIKVGTEVVASDLIKGDSEVKNFTVEVKDNKGEKINVSASDLKILENGKEVKFTYNDSVVTITDKLSIGIHNLTITYKGTDTLIESAKNIILTVYGINVTTSANINSTKQGNVKIDVIAGNESIAVNASDLTLNATYKKGNDTVVIPISSYTIENGTLIFTLENGNFTTATLNIKYNNTEANVTLNRIYNVRIDVINGVNQYLNGNFTYKLVDLDDEATIVPKGTTVSLTTIGNIRAGFSATTDENGVVNYRTANLYEFDNTGTDGSINLDTHTLTVGDHTVEISTSGNIKSTTLKTNLTITKATINIVIDNFREEYGTDKKVKITVTNANNKEAVPGIVLRLDMPQTSGKTYYFQTNVNGTSEISVSQLVGGTYDLTVSNNDTKNINKKTVKGSITIVPKPVVINTKKSITLNYNSGNTATIKITDKATGKPVAGVIVLVRFDNNDKKTYLFQADSKGVVKFAASLDVGKHKMVVSTADTRYSGSSVTVTITVKKVTAKISAPKVTTYYKSGKYFTVKLTNSKTKKPIYDGKLNIKVYVSSTRYYNYNGNTGSNGQLKLSLDNLKPGSYKVEVTGAANKNFVAKKVTSKIVIKKAPTKLTPKKLTAKKGAKKYFQIKVTNKKTKKIIKGVKLKVKVYTGKKYKTYTVKTNSKGIAKLSTKSLKVGKHKVIVKSANKYCVAKAARSTIKITKK